MEGVIYEIRNINTGKFYIGSTTNFKRRKYKHLCDLKANRHVNNHLQNSFNKHGREAFKISLIMYVSDTIEVEQLMINCLNLSELYNISPNAVGGDIIHTFSEERKKRIYKKMSNTKKKMNLSPSNKVELSIDGKIYESLHNASKELDVPIPTVRYRCHSKNSKFKDWYIIGNKPTKEDLYNQGDSQGINIICEGEEFPSIASAAREYDISGTSIKFRLESDNFPEFNYK